MAPEPTARGAGRFAELMGRWRIHWATSYAMSIGRFGTAPTDMLALRVQILETSCSQYRKDIHRCHHLSRWVSVRRSAYPAGVAIAAADGDDLSGGVSQLKRQQRNSELSGEKRRSFPHEWQVPSLARKARARSTDDCAGAADGCRKRFCVAPVVAV